MNEFENQAAPSEGTENSDRLSSELQQILAQRDTPEAKNHDESEARPFLRPVPSLEDRALIGDYPEKFTYTRDNEANLGYAPKPDAEKIEMSEKEGVILLKEFLHKFASEVGPNASPEDMELAEQAHDILRYITFIGEEEMQLATSAFAEQWKAFLDENPNRKLYLWSQEGKSSTYILDQSLSHFSDAELAKYHEQLRFVKDLTQYYQPGDQPELPPKSKIVMIDDWTATGRQLSDAYSKEIDMRLNINGYIEPPPVEINLVAATKVQAEKGIVTTSGSYGVDLPIHAIYEANPTTEGGAYATGLHSSTDDYFEVPIARMVQRLRENGHPDATMPPLTNIERQYRIRDYRPMNIERLAALQT